MSTRGRPPKRPKSEPPPENSWLAAAAEFAANPDSPQSLQLMSALNSAVRPRAEAARQLVEALALQIEQPGAPADAAVQAAIGHWEAATGGAADEQLLKGLREEAAVLLQERNNRPPPVESIIAGFDKTDVGYEMGLHMQGLRGTWHRLWASIAMGPLLEGGPAQLACIAEVRGQFESLLGRPMSTEEWEALERHALAHASAIARRER